MPGEEQHAAALTRPGGHDPRPRLDAGEHLRVRQRAELDQLQQQAPKCANIARDDPSDAERRARGNAARLVSASAIRGR